MRGPKGRNWRYRWFKAKENGEICYYEREEGKAKILKGLVSE